MRNIRIAQRRNEFQARNPKVEGRKKPEVRNPKNQSGKRMLKLLQASFLSGLLCIGALVQAEPVPLTRVHAHNDYEHKRPLFDALDQGFCSVEADIYLVDGKLLVAHDRDKVRPERTLQALYLDPLRERVKKNHGRVYSDGPEFTLLIDLKSDWRKIYP